jgi:hypothetical protein
MSKLNCWELKKCGREAGGAKSNEMGICPAAAAVYAGPLQVHSVVEKSRGTLHRNQYPACPVKSSNR